MALLKRTTALLAVMLMLGTAACTDSDAVITDKVKAAIANEPALKGTQVSVSTKEKVVHLSGTVKSRGERAMLIAVARKVEGVKDLKTDLAVAPQQKPAVAAQQKPAAKPQQKTAAKPKPKPTAEARAKQAQPAPRSFSPPPVVGD
jgi:hypothetical protein